MWERQKCNNSYLKKNEKMESMIRCTECKQCWTQIACVCLDVKHKRQLLVLFSSNFHISPYSSNLTGTGCYTNLFHILLLPHQQYFAKRDVMVLMNRNRKVIIYWYF